jgi:hypothetical protein
VVEEGDADAELWKAMRSAMVIGLAGWPYDDCGEAGFDAGDSSGESGVSRGLGRASGDNCAKRAVAQRDTTSAARAGND